MAKESGKNIEFTRLQIGPIHHAELPAFLLTRIQNIAHAFAEADSNSESDWVDGFQHDANPEADDAIWEVRSGCI